MMDAIALPLVIPQRIAVNTGLVFGSVIVVQIVTGTSSVVVPDVVLTTGAIFNSVTVIGITIVSHKVGLPLSQTITLTLEGPK